MNSKDLDVSLRALESLLRPAVRFCLRRSLKFQQVLAALKRVFVAVAREEIQHVGAEASQSRLSVMTGLQRPDISQILKETTPRTEASLVTRVIGNWANDARFLNQQGLPRSLSCSGRNSEFSLLVSTVSRELNPYAVLFELERLGLVRRTDSSVELLSAIHLVGNDAEQAFQLLASDMDDLFESVEANALSKLDLPNLHLKSHYDNIAIEHLPEIRAWILEEGSKFIFRVQQYLANFDKDLNPRLVGKEGGGRIAVGVFSNHSHPEIQTLKKASGNGSPLDLGKKKSK